MKETIRYNKDLDILEVWKDNKVIKTYPAIIKIKEKLEPVYE